MRFGVVRILVPVVTVPGRPGTAAPERPRPGPAPASTRCTGRGSRRARLCAGQCGLRSHQRQVVVDTGIHAVGLIAQRACGQIDIRPGDFHQLCGGSTSSRAERTCWSICPRRSSSCELTEESCAREACSLPRSFASRKIGTLSVPWATNVHAYPRRSPCRLRNPPKAQDRQPLAPVRR